MQELKHRFDDAPVEWSEPSSVISASFNRDGTEEVTGTNDGKVHVWNVWTGKQAIISSSQPDRPARSAGVNVVTFDRNGDQFLTGGTEGIGLIWDAKMKKPLARPLSGHA